MTSNSFDGSLPEGDVILATGSRPSANSGSTTDGRAAAPATPSGTRVRSEAAFNQRVRAINKKRADATATEKRALTRQLRDLNDANNLRIAAEKKAARAAKKAAKAAPPAKGRVARLPVKKAAPAKKAPAKRARPPRAR